MFALIIIATVVLCAIGYKFYGNFLTHRCEIDDSRKTPAHTLNDGVDYVPTRASILFGHHFSSIAGTGPIVGPILAGLYFGWGPAWMWIVIGSIFVGGIHDFGSALMSVRNGGKSIADTSCKLVGAKTGKLFVLFVLCALVYVIVVFLDVTASTFVSSGSVPTASGWFILMALIFGFFITKSKLPVQWLICIFVPLTFIGLWIGQVMPINEVSKSTWLWVIIGYVYLAAIAPVNLLLQPRDFLSSFFLFAVLIAGVVGAVFALPTVEAPFFKGWTAEVGGETQFILPFLFITIACGACSGFHSIVASGTTSKQIAQERDIKRIGYGSMLVEGILATLALGSLIVLSSSSLEGLGGNPVRIFAAGFGQISSSLGIPPSMASDFALLAVSTFLLTTLDTCTRLCRFLLEELFSWRDQYSRYIGTLLCIGLPAAIAFQEFNGIPAWKAIWPLFGSTNQLLAALALITFVVYLRSKRIKAGFALWPALIMIAMPLIALAMMTYQYGPTSMLGSMSLIMLLLGIFVSYRSIHTVIGGSRAK